MSWRVLPPAGHPISFAPSADFPSFEGYRAVWVQSGTAALSLALIAARCRHHDIADPEVILPGYACPDLVAAAEYAGVTPVLADIGENDPGYDLSVLNSALSARTVAIVAVNFLGLRERLSDLRGLLRAWPSVALIEDDAQWFPEPITAPDLAGDLICLSFGRGKPVSLLGGGALLIRDSFNVDNLDTALSSTTGAVFSPKKAQLYNLLLSPWVYGLVARAPFLKLGATAFKPLHIIQPMDMSRQSLVLSNMQNYFQREETVARDIANILPAQVIDLPTSLVARKGRLLRYPLLCATGDVRDQILSRLHQKGLGATAMYQQCLPAIDGVADKIKISGELVGAQKFARRLITLPTHSAVTAKDIRQMKEAFDIY